MDWKVWYAALKEANPEAYGKAVQYASSLDFKHNLGTKMAAEIEQSLVMFACELLNVTPRRP